jgi:hypothetical protein
MTVCRNPLLRSLLGAKRACVVALHMSAYDPKQTLTNAPHMSAFEGKADMAFCGNPLSRSLLRVKRTSGFCGRICPLMTQSGLLWRCLCRRHVSLRNHHFHKRVTHVSLNGTSAMGRKGSACHDCRHDRAGRPEGRRRSGKSACVPQVTAVYGADATSTQSV